ncbi:MAG: RNA ligase family protein [Sphingopyxis sp.]
MLGCFTAWVKYPRTYVLPWSDTIGEGDRRLASLAPLSGEQVVVTEKMDGENVSLYRDFLHTRSVRRIAHPSREWLNHFWESVRGQIPEDWRICGEYLYASHTVSYDALPSYFLAFSVWNERNICLSWPDTLAFLAELGIEPVPALYAGPLDQQAIHRAWREKEGQSEGYIVRSAGEIPYRRFRHLVGKYIRESYVQSEPVKENMRTGAAIRKNALG